MRAFVCFLSLCGCGVGGGGTNHQPKCDDGNWGKDLILLDSRFRRTRQWWRERGRMVPAWSRANASSAGTVLPHDVGAPGAVAGRAASPRRGAGQGEGSTQGTAQPRFRGDGQSTTQACGHACPLPVLFPQPVFSTFFSSRFSSMCTVFMGFSKKGAVPCCGLGLETRGPVLTERGSTGMIYLFCAANLAD